MDLCGCSLNKFIEAITNYPPLSAGIGSEKAYYYTMLRLVTVNGLLQNHADYLA